MAHPSFTLRMWPWRVTNNKCVAVVASGIEDCNHFYLLAHMKSGASIMPAVYIAHDNVTGQKIFALSVYNS